jgi:hypothetical protein
VRLADGRPAEEAVYYDVETYSISGRLSPRAIPLQQFPRAQRNGDAVHRAIRERLLMSPGEWFAQPDLGSSLSDLLGGKK